MKLDVKNIVKVYPGTRALDDVTTSFESGKVTALIGKNGSGKSTLVKLLAGVIQPTSGEIFIDGEPYVVKTPGEAHRKGIVTVYQEMSLIPGLTVAENIFLNRMPKQGKLIDWRSAYQQSTEFLHTMGVDINPRKQVQDLSMWQKQIVEITKAMTFSPKILLLDEPTSALAINEVQNLLEFVRSLKERDIIVIYITHKLQELRQVADEVAVLRDGKFVGQVPMDEIDDKGIINMMFGAVKIRQRPKDIIPINEPVMKVSGLTRKKAFQNVSFELKKGEVLGIAGMLGSGRTELLRSIFGADSFQSGTVEINGEKISRFSPGNMVDHGVGLTPEERKTEGLILIHSIKDNLCYASIRQNQIAGFLEDKKKRDTISVKQVKNLDIRTPNITNSCNSLSGGNQQKVVVGNWLNTNPMIMLYDEPSRGIDVNAKQQIFEIMWDSARNGISSIFVSTELEELLEVCHRLLIMYRGKIIGEVDPEKCSVEELYACCMSGEISPAFAMTEQGS